MEEALTIQMQLCNETLTPIFGELHMDTLLWDYISYT